MFRTIAFAFQRVYPLAAVFFLSSGCFIQSDYDVPLPNGYLLVSCNEYDIVIACPKELDGTIVVPPLIVAIGVHGDIVFGKVEDSHAPWLLEEGERAKTERADQEKARGFFLINTKTHAVQLGLTTHAWIEALKDLGICDEPTLKKPSRAFTY